MSSKLDDLNLSRDEFNRIAEALKKDEFRKLFLDYARELNDPEQRRLYETELTQLEAERGVDVKFINPEGGFVVKTSVDGKMKCFINVAKCDRIDKPSSEVVVGDGQKGLSWKLPYSQAQPRKDVDRAGKPAMVYDVVFHPDTLYMAEKNARFKRLVVETACDAVSQAFSVTIDKSNLKFPKMVFKGTPQPTLIRKKRPGPVEPREPNPLDKFYPPVTESQVRQHKDLTDASKTVADYAVPKYQITHRRDIEYHELTEEMDAKLNVLHPKELVVAIELPLLSSTKDVNLDVTSEKLVLVSEAPAKYKLELKLPCTVQEHEGTAKFDKDSRKLVVVLPVSQKRKNLAELMREDSGVECSVDSVSSEDDDAVIGGLEELKPPASPEPEIPESAVAATEDSFLNPNHNYQLPSFNLSRVDNFAAFTLHVKNVDPDTVEVDQKPGGKAVHVKFCSIGAGFYPAHYAFFLEIPSDNTAMITEATTEAWDNNLILQLELDTADSEAFHCYAAGLDQASLINYEVTEKLAKHHTGLGRAIEDDSLCIPVEKKAAPVVKKPEKKMRSMSESYCDELKIINELECLEIESAKRTKNKSKKVSKEAAATNAAAEKQQKLKMRCISESSSDEHVSTKPSTGGGQRAYKSILKKRGSYDRSMSECSMSMDLDHYSSSMDYGSYEPSSVAQSHDSDFAGSLKKTVRFNDKIRRQLFRSDVSILHKREKNIKRRLKQQRALVRRHSEGSEGDQEFNEKDSSTENGSHDEKFEPKVGDAPNSEAMKIKNGANKKNKRKPTLEKQTSISGADGDKGWNSMEFKTGMIFDLEM